MKKIILAIACSMSVCWGCSDNDADSLQPTDRITLSKDLISLGFEGGTEEITVTSSGDWRMSGSSTWAHPSATEGKSGETVVFTIDPNTTDRNLQSEFKLFTGSAVARLTVTCGEGYVLTLDSESAVSVPRTGGDFAVKLSTNIPQDELTCTCSDGGDDWIAAGECVDLFGDLLMAFTASENTDYSNRATVLRISGHDLSIEVSVSQQQVDYLNVKGDRVYEFENLDAASFSLEVESNVDYTVTTPDWITYEQVGTRSITTDLLRFDLSEGTTTRLGEVVIADANKLNEVRIAVRQFAPGAQIISIPDKNFRLKLAERGWIAVIDEDSPDVILYDLETIKKNDNYPNILRVDGAGIKSLEGIENFPWVTQCNLGNNSELEKVDISALENVTSVDTSNDTMLSEIICGSNACTIGQGGRIGVPMITISGGVKSINLTAYYISDDRLTELDVSACPDLSTINARGRDQLTTIYISAEQEGRIVLLGTGTATFVVKQ